MSIFSRCEKLNSSGRIVNQKLPFEVTALAVVQVAGFTGVEVGSGIVIDLAIDVTVLEVGDCMASFAAGDISRRNVINAGSSTISCHS